MPPNLAGAGAAAPSVPSMLDFVRLSPRLLFPPGGVDLYRQIALLTDMAEGAEVLDVACGKGISLEYFVREYGVQGSGVEADGRLVDEAEARAKESGLSSKIQFQIGRSDALPYRDAIFDVVVGELGLAAQCDPTDAVGELVRVTKPGGMVVLVQLVWKASVDEGRKQMLSEHLGALPLMLVQWKHALKGAGVVQVHSEEWADPNTSFRAKDAKPFPDFAEIFSVPEKIGVLRRAWSRWGWGGVRVLLQREREVHRLLTRERTLGLDLLKGRKAAVEPEPDEVPDAAPQEAPGEVQAVAPSAQATEKRKKEPDEGGGTETSGLPLFRIDEGQEE